MLSEKIAALIVTVMNKIPLTAHDKASLKSQDFNSVMDLADYLANNATGNYSLEEVAALFTELYPSKA